MYDELVKRLKEDKSWVEQGTTETEHEIAKHIQQAADAIEEPTRRCEQFRYMPPPAWIPVTERLPKYGDWVLGIGPKKGYHVCEYRGISHFVYGGDTPWFSAKGRSITVTHWMPLPEPPEEET